MAYGRAVVGVFPSAMEAALAQGFLEQEGIPSWLEGVIASTWAGGELPLTGVPLLVPEADLARATSLLEGVSGKMRDVVAPFVDEGELAAEAAAAGPAERFASESEASDDTGEAVEEAPDRALEARREAVLRSARRGMAAALLALLLVGFVFAAVALVIFTELAVRERWRQLPGKMRWLVGAAVLWCAAIAAFGFYLLAHGVRWWWLSGWL